MSAHVLLIDGYNVIRRSPQLARSDAISLQHGREALITLLAFRYGGHDCELIVVFDGAERVETHTTQRGLHIVFSAAGCTADSCIVRMSAEAHARGQHVTVATDDAGIRAALGATTPAAHTTSAGDLNNTLYAPDRLRRKQYQHHQAISAKGADDAEPQDRSRGNPRRAPRKRH